MFYFIFLVCGQASSFLMPFIFSQIYHACDGPGLSVLCFMRYDILEYFSIYGTALSIWVSLMGKQGLAVPAAPDICRGGLRASLVGAGFPGSENHPFLLTFPVLSPSACLLMFRFPRDIPSRRGALRSAEPDTSLGSMQIRVI